MEKLSELALNLEGQKMFQILAKTQELERQGKEILHFEIGDPDFSTPKNIKDAAYQALEEEYTHYTASSGLYEFKIAAADVTARSRGFRPNLSQLVVAPANYQIRLATGCGVNPKEEVIIPDPCFVSYSSLIKNNGSKAIRVPVLEENEFRLDPKDVEKAVTSKTKMIIINSPSNPTGGVMKEDEIKGIYDIAEKNDLYLLSDEVYARMIYKDSGIEFSSPSKYDNCKRRTIVVNGFSKSYAMTGWRMGCATGPSHLIEKMGLLLESEFSCIPPFIQKAGIEALKGSQEPIFDMVDEFNKRRKVIVDGLNTLPNVKCVAPKGAFYAFPNIKETKLSSQEFTDIMIEEAGVSTCPGHYFGPSGEGYVRLCYANSIENIERGIDRMKYVLKNPNIIEKFFERKEETNKLEGKINKLQSLRMNEENFHSRKDLDESIVKLQSKYNLITGNYFSPDY